VANYNKIAGAQTKQNQNISGKMCAKSITLALFKGRGGSLEN
jgi:hypothetical protein